MSTSSNAFALEQIKEVLQALSMSFDNFLEVNKSTTIGTNTAVQLKHSQSQSQSQSPPPASFPRFQRPSRKVSSPTGINEPGSRKRSLELDEEKATENGGFESGKRSKSLVLAQEQLEGLQLSSPSKAINRLDSELNDWASHDLNTPRRNSSVVEGVEELKRELEVSGALNRIDDVLKVLCSYTENTSNNANNRTNMNNWVKWNIVNEVIESFKSTELSSKTIINRTVRLLVALLKISALLDWSDPELCFLSHKLMIRFLNSEKFKHNNNNINNINSNSYNRRLEEFLGILRALNLFCRLPFQAAAQMLLLSHALPQVVELLEILLETNLNIFELTATQTTVINDDFTTFNLACVSVLLTLKVFEQVTVEIKCKEVKELILSIKNRIF